MGKQYLSTQEVRVAAQGSESEAIKCTILHWEQITAATREGLRYCPMNGTHCALCVRAKGNCSTCILKTCLVEGSNYNWVSLAVEGLKTYEITIDEFRVRCRLMLEEVRGLL